jgi:hypothetical protein
MYGSELLPNFRTRWQVVLAAFVVAVSMLVSLGIGTSAEAGRSKVGISVSDAGYADSVAAYVTGAESTTAKAASTSDSSDYWVRASCSQDGSLVSKQTVRVSGGTAMLTLGPTRLWTSGSADCVAELGSFSKRGRWKSAATTTFHVAG